MARRVSILVGVGQWPVLWTVLVTTRCCVLRRCCLGMRTGHHRKHLSGLCTEGSVLICLALACLTWIARQVCQRQCIRACVRLVTRAIIATPVLRSVRARRVRMVATAWTVWTRTSASVWLVGVDRSARPMLTSVRLLHARTGAFVLNRLRMFLCWPMRIAALASLGGRGRIVVSIPTSVRLLRVRMACARSRHWSGARWLWARMRALATLVGRVWTATWILTSAHRLLVRTAVCAVSPSLTRRSAWTLTHALVRLGGRGRTALATWMSVRLLRA